VIDSRLRAGIGPKIGRPSCYSRCLIGLHCAAFAVNLLGGAYPASATAGELISDSALGFTLRLPDGFRIHPYAADIAPRVPHLYVQGDPSDDSVDIVLAIAPMGGTISQRPIAAEDLPNDFHGTVFREQWNGFFVDTFESSQTVGEFDLVEYNVQIPLKTRAIQLSLVGPENRRAELRLLLTQVLTNLVGETDWVRPAWFGALRSRDDYGLILTAVGILGVLVALIILWLVTKKSPRGTALIVGVLAIVASQSSDATQLREWLLLSACLRIFGVVSGILGVIDLARGPRSRRQRKQEAS